MTETQMWLILRVCDFQRFLNFFEIDDRGGNDGE